MTLLRILKGKPRTNVEDVSAAEEETTYWMKKV
jgi:hypothetical protein